MSKTCYLCNTQNTQFYQKISGFPVYKCNACNLLWVPSEYINDNDIKKFYSESYYHSNLKTGYKDYVSNELLHRKNALNIINIVDGYKKLSPKKVLDIGCAYGFLLDELKKRKQCDVYGIESSEYSAHYATSKLGLNVINSAVNYDLFEKDFFDFIFLIGTIEHLQDPTEMLKYIQYFLKPEGILVITTIDTKGIIPLYMIKPPEHLFYFNHSNIMNLLNKNGFSKVVIRPYFANYFLHDLFMRLKDFTSWNFLGVISQKIAHHFPRFFLKIPTNEMIIIVKKQA